MYELQKALSTIGVGGVLWSLSQCPDAHAETVRRVATGSIPQTLVSISSKQWKLGVQKCLIGLMQERKFQDVLLLGNDLALLEAFAALEFEGKINIMLSPNLTSDEGRRVSKNVPKGLQVTVLAPGQVPVLSSSTTVVTIGIDAGGGYLMVDTAVARALGSIRGQRFTGNVIGMQPLKGVIVHERQANWQLVPVSQFTDICDAEGVAPNIPKI